MAQEMTLAEIGTKVNGLLLDPVTRTLEIASSSIQLNLVLLQAALEAGIASIQAGRKFLEAVQKSSIDTADALSELGVANTQAWIEMAQSFQGSLRSGKA